MTARPRILAVLLVALLVASCSGGGSGGRDEPNADGYTGAGSTPTGQGTGRVSDDSG